MKRCWKMEVKEKESVNILHRSHHKPLELVGFTAEKLYTGKTDKEGKPLFAGDVIENDNRLRFEIRFGEFTMYCPVDDCMMENVGFFCVADGYYEDMPLGPTEQYAKKIGNVRDNPELVVAEEYRCQVECGLENNSIYKNGNSKIQECNLSARELEIVNQLYTGMSNRDIGKKFGITESTVKNHLRNIFKKIGCTDRTQAAMWSLKHNLRR